MKRVLVVAAHADDEVLGCGGTIARHVAEGDNVSVVFLADGVTSRGETGSDSALAVSERKKSAQKAHEILGIQRTFYLGFPDNRLDSLALLDIVQALENVIAEVNPTVIYTHHHGDLNVDHRISCEAVLTACRPQPGCSVKEIYAFEVMSSTEWNSPECEPFTPNLYVDITPYWSQKKLALEAYRHEMRPSPHSRSIEHLEILAKHRGMCVGMEMAEGFMLIRKLH